MPNPQTDDFEYLLHGLTMAEPQDRGGLSQFEILPEQPVYDVRQTEGVRIGPQIARSCHLWYPSDSRISMEALLRRLTGELISRGHAIGPSTTPIVVALFAFLRSTSPSGARLRAVELLNSVLDHTYEADVSHFFVLPVAAGRDFQPVHFGTFTIGRFDVEKARGRAEKAKSSWASDVDVTRLRGRLAIERLPVNVRVISWNALSMRYPARDLSGEEDGLGFRLLNAYFGDLAWAHMQEFWTAISDEQHLIVAAGGPWTDPRIFQQLVPSERVTIYLNIGAERFGWVAPGSAVLPALCMSRTLVERTSIIERRLNSEFQGHAAADSEANCLMGTYARFLSQSERFRSDGHFDEAFLHYVIALDLLFGEQNAASKHVAERTSIIVYRAFGRSFDEQSTVMQHVYDARSRYVHRGDSISKGSKNSLLEEVRRASREVFWCLARAQRQPDLQQAGFRERWLTHLDLLVSTVKANRPISDSEYVLCGISKEETVPLPDTSMVVQSPFYRFVDMEEFEKRAAAT